MKRLVLGFALSLLAFTVQSVLKTTDLPAATRPPLVPRSGIISRLITPVMLPEWSKRCILII
jgi:hypothetical protein